MQSRGENNLKTGATTYVFRYALSRTPSAPGLPDLLDRARSAGLERLQICENARPLTLDPAGWTALARRAREIDLEIGLGCMTADPSVVREYLDRVTAIGGSMLRIVLERAGAGPVSVDRIQAFLDRIVPELENRGVRLAIENHLGVATLERRSIRWDKDVVDPVRCGIANRDQSLRRDRWL